MGNIKLGKPHSVRSESIDLRSLETCCSIYYDIAVSKVNRVHREARRNEFPLKCGYEEA